MSPHKQGRYTTPYEVRELLRQADAEYKACESPSLLLSKFTVVGNAQKKEAIQTVISAVASNPQIPMGLPARDGDREFWGKLQSRMMVNMTGGILENAGLCLHRHFGIPLIPGSALKGIARHAAWCEWSAAENAEAKETIALEIASVFGYPIGERRLDDFLKAHGVHDHAGCVAFLPASPVMEKSQGFLEMDVLTCHHPDYYSGKKEEATDDESPNPQFFPAVQAGILFRFLLRPLRGATEAHLDRAHAWLTQALTEHGVGAKTAAGYGWFEVENATRKELDGLEANRLAQQREAELKRLKEEVATLEAEAGDTLTSEQVEALSDLRQRAKALGSIDQSIQERLNRLKKKLPQKGDKDVVFEQLNGKKNVDAILKDDNLKRFNTRTKSKQEAIVAFLLEEPKGRETLARIKGGAKGFPGDAQKAIINAVKAANGGRLP